MIKVYLKIFLSFLFIQLLILLDFVFFDGSEGLIGFIKALVYLLFPFITLFICLYEKIENRNRYFIIDTLYAVFLEIAFLFIPHLTKVYILKRKLPADSKSEFLFDFFILAFFASILFVGIVFQILLLFMSRKWKLHDGSRAKPSPDWKGPRSGLPWWVSLSNPQAMEPDGGTLESG